MEVIPTGCAIVRGNDVSGRNGLRQFVNLSVHCQALTFAIRLHHFSCEQRHIIGVEIEVTEEACINGIYFICPERVAGIGCMSTPFITPSF